MSKNGRNVKGLAENICYSIFVKLLVRGTSFVMPRTLLHTGLLNQVSTVLFIAFNFYNQVEAT